MRLKTLLTISIIALLALFSCRKSYQCYVQDYNGEIYDTIVCKCYKEVVKELEASPYNAGDSAEYQINCN